MTPGPDDLVIVARATNSTQRYHASRECSHVDDRPAHSREIMLKKIAPTHQPCPRCHDHLTGEMSTGNAERCPGCGESEVAPSHIADCVQEVEA
jgi:hypothetical protein